MPECKGRETEEAKQHNKKNKNKKNIIHPSRHIHHQAFLSLEIHLRSRNKKIAAAMGRFSDAQALQARQEDEEDLFETSSSISGDDSDDEARLLELEGLQVAPKTVRRLNSDGVYDMSSIKAELPVKKGLSRYYDGKSQSFFCMSDVRSLEDLPKKRPSKKFRSHVDLDDSNQEACPAPGPKGKPSGSSCANLMTRNNAAANLLYRAPAIPVNKSAYHQ